MAEQSTSDCTIPYFMQQKDYHAYKTKLTAKSIEIPIPCLKDKYVQMIPNAFSDEECKELIRFSETIGYKDALVNLGFGHTERMNEFRKHKKLTVDNTEVANYVFNRIKSVIPNQFHNREIIDINERLRFLKYAAGNYFGPHYDGMYIRDNGERSLITILIYLNDNYDGGEITFLHPTNENKKYWIKPQTGMILLFEQKEVYHEGAIVTNNIINSENMFKYCIRSDIMFSKQRIDESKVTNEQINNSYEVEKQTVYFQRKQSPALKSSEYQPNLTGKKSKMNKLYETSLTLKVIDFWFIEAFEMNNDKRIFPLELLEEIAKYCRIIGILDFICDPAELEQLARVSETAERYEEMTEIMTELVKLNSRQFKCNHSYIDIGLESIDDTHDEKCDILTVDQRNLFSVAFKNVVGAKRASWRTISGEVCSLTKEEKKEDFVHGDEKRKKPQLYVCNEYLRVIQMELHAICSLVIELLNDYIINKIKHCPFQGESLVFYLKMAGDYNRYLAEWCDTPIYKEKANEYYSDALKIGREKLKHVHPTLLGLGLNYAVYLYEIAKEPQKACDLAKTCFDTAIEKLDLLDDHSYKDSTLIMRLLRDNLTLWTSTDDDDQ